MAQNISPLDLKQTFAAQFEPNGSGYLYRRYSKGAPIPVTAEERDRFIAAYRRSCAYFYGSIYAGTVAVFGIVVWYDIATKSNVSGAPIYVGITIVAVGALFYSSLAFNAPQRELRSRPAVGEARSRQELRRVMMGRTTYAQLMGIAVAAVFCFGRLLQGPGYFVGWNLLWLVACGVVVLSLAVTAFRKWRINSRPD